MVLEVMTAATRPSLLDVWVCIIEAARFQRRCGCTCAAGSNVQGAGAKIGIVQEDSSWKLDGSH